MRDDDSPSLPVSTPSVTTSSSTTISKKEHSGSILFGRGRYKFWALAAILLLAFWSMFTGTVTLRWSAGNLNRFSDDIGPPLLDDVDVLEIEEREKVVKHMWDVYTNNRRIRIPRFWQEAFVAAYEDLTSDDPQVREAAIAEIAKMSFRSIDLESPPIRSTPDYKLGVYKEIGSPRLVEYVSPDLLKLLSSLSSRAKHSHLVTMYAAVRELSLKQAQKTKTVTSGHKRL